MRQDKDILWLLEDYDSDERECSILIQNAAFEIKQLRARVDLLEDKLEEAQYRQLGDDL